MAASAVLFAFMNFFVKLASSSASWQTVGFVRALVGASLLASIAMMMLRRVGQTETAEAIAAQYSLFAAATFGLLSLADLRMPTVRDALAMIAAGICAGFGQILLTRAYTLERAARVSGIGYLSVVASALLGAAILNERPATSALLGMSLVVLGGLVVTFTRDKLAPAVSPRTGGG